MKRQAGMTLIEVMVALVIFALAGLAVMQSTLQQTRQLGRMEEKILASWLADNQLVQLRLEKRWPALSWSETTVEAAGNALVCPLARGGNRAAAAAGAGRGGPAAKKRSRAAGDPAHLGDAAMITRMRGFTLIETLLALAILAVLSAAAVMVLQNVIRADGLTREKSQQIAALQRAFRQIADDVTHIIPRRARNSDTLFFAGRFQLQSDDWGLAFSRSGWPNPLGILPRSEIQNVSYRLRQQQLERLSFDQQDPLTGSQPTVRVVLREVTAFRLRFYADGRWQETWDRSQTLPQGLEITLTLANSGEITRLFLLTPGGSQ